MNHLERQTILAGLVGGIALYLYGMLVWMGLHVYDPFFPLIPQYGRVQSLLSELPLKGGLMYQIGDWKQPGLKGTLQILSGSCYSPLTLVTAFFLNIAVSLLLARYYVRNLAEKKNGAKYVFSFYLFAGFMVYGLWQAAEVIWMGGDPIFHGIRLIDGLLGFLLMGSITAFFVGSAKSARR